MLTPENPLTNHPKISVLLKNYIPALDGYRAISFLLVLMSHTADETPVQPSGLIDHLYAMIMTNTRLGVHAFFVLSGFLITGILLNNYKQPNFFRNFYIRRLIRVFPLYFGFLIVFFWILNFALNDDDVYQNLSEKQIYFFLCLQNWVYAFKAVSEENPLIHFWSLAVEEQFYLIWPLLIYLVPKSKLKFLCVGMILFSLGMRFSLLPTMPIDENISSPEIYYNTFCQMFSLAIGSLLFLFMDSARGLIFLFKIGKPTIIVTSILLIPLIFRGNIRLLVLIYAFIGEFLASILFAAILVLSVTQPQESILVRFLTYPPLRYMGKISYGLYIYHYVFIWYLESLTFSHNYILNHLIYVLFFGAIALCISTVSWYFLEKPILHLKVYFKN